MSVFDRRVAAGSGHLRTREEATDLYLTDGDNDCSGCRLESVHGDYCHLYSPTRRSARAAVIVAFWFVVQVIQRELCDVPKHRHHGASTPRCIDTTVHRHHGASTPRCSDTTVQRHHGAATPRCSDTTVQRHHGASWKFLRDVSKVVRLDELNTAVHCTRKHNISIKLN